MIILIYYFIRGKQRYAEHQKILFISGDNSLTSVCQCTFRKETIFKIRSLFQIRIEYIIACDRQHTDNIKNITDFFIYKFVIMKVPVKQIKDIRYCCRR